MTDEDKDKCERYLHKLCVDLGVPERIFRGPPLAEQPMTEPGEPTIGEMYGKPRLKSVIDTLAVKEEFEKYQSGLHRYLALTGLGTKPVDEDVQPDHVVGGSDESQAKQT